MPLLKDTAPGVAADSVLFPLLLKSVVAVGLSAYIGADVRADVTPHGRPANLSSLPGLAVGLAGSAASDTSQTYGFVEGKTSQRLLFTIGLQNHKSTSDSIAVNGDVELSGDGITWGLYYQLAETDRYHWTIGLRSLTAEKQEDSLIVSGASRVNLERNQRAVELSLLTEYKAWSTTNVKPYFAANVKRSSDGEIIATTGGREISNSRTVPFSASVSAGLLYRYRLLSLFIEGTLGSDEDVPVAIHAGLRLGFFNRPNTP